MAPRSVEFEGWRRWDTTRQPTNLIMGGLALDRDCWAAVRYAMASARLYHRVLVTFHGHCSNRSIQCRIASCRACISMWSKDLLQGWEVSAVEERLSHDLGIFWQSLIILKAFSSKIRAPEEETKMTFLFHYSGFKILRGRMLIKIKL